MLGFLLLFFLGFLWVFCLFVGFVVVLSVCVCVCVCVWLEGSLYIVLCWELVSYLAFKGGF